MVQTLHLPIGKRKKHSGEDSDDMESPYHASPVENITNTILISVSAMHCEDANQQDNQAGGGMVVKSTMEATGSYFREQSAQGQSFSVELKNGDGVDR